MYDMEGVSVQETKRLSTPFGAPSDDYTIAHIDGNDKIEVVFLPRHGRGHTVTPSEINYRANVFGMKSLGVEWIVSVTAVGSLCENKSPGEMVLVNQFIDRTHGREHTFFGQGIVSHVPWADPICDTARGYLKQACEETGVCFHADDENTLVCIEGPSFSTKAESNLYRSWGASVVGMTNLTEAKLAREAEISFATLAMVTDFDAWHPDHDSVTVEQVVATAMKNVATAKEVVKAFVQIAGEHSGEAPCSNAMAGACMTAPDRIPVKRRDELEVLVGKYM